MAPALRLVAKVAGHPAREVAAGERLGPAPLEVAAGAEVECLSMGGLAKRPAQVVEALAPRVKLRSAVKVAKVVNSPSAYF